MKGGSIMPVIQVLELSRRYRNQWVVLDQRYNVLDHGGSLGDLRAKHAAEGRRTFMLVSG
ncbi:MAG: hypothetical protein A2X36_14650 [Elusimicrobia bacterium GWA2_69_24]|nr:MAG: hypothetical protein A2X36_14650 [Elusimicrobia bacterium GWA2_69_24]